MSDLEYKPIIDIVGIDLKRQGAIISWLSEDMTDATTVCDESGESLVIPISMAKERSLGRWYAGNEAKKKFQLDGAILVEDLFTKAKEKEIIRIEDRDYSYEELFATYIRKIIEDNGIETAKLNKLVISVPEVDVRSVELFATISSRLSLKKDVFTLIDHKESFIYYTFNQNQNIFARDVALYEYENGRIISYLLSRNTATKPQMIDISVDKIEITEGEKDKLFYELVERTLASRITNTAFLMGDGFEKEWMDESIKLLCKGRRVFLGDNLYSKGACFAGRVKLGRYPWNYVYIGDHEMKMNLSLKVSDRNDINFATLVEAGENWYETGREFEVILEGSPEIECWIHSPETRHSKVQKIELKMMPNRENRTTRLRISANPTSDTKVMMTIRDLGFGDIAPSTGRVWKHEIDFNAEGNNG